MTNRMQQRKITKIQQIGRKSKKVIEKAQKSLNNEAKIRRKSKTQPDSLVKTPTPPKFKVHDTSGHEGLASWIHAAAVNLNEALYASKALEADERHLNHVGKEIDYRVRSDGGVLVKRMTQRKLDPEGTPIPAYIGLQVVGGGSSQEAALARYYDRGKEPFVVDATECTAENPSGAPMHCEFSGEESTVIGSITVKNIVCTPLNPTGRGNKSQAEIKPAPKGFNMGYASQTAKKISDVVNSGAGNQYLEEDLFYISKEEWDNRKANSPNQSPNTDPSAAAPDASIEAPTPTMSLN